MYKDDSVCTAPRGSVRAPCKERFWSLAGRDARIAHVLPALPTIYLASRSPRRRRLLDEHGIRHRVLPPGVDDAGLMPGGTTPAGWVAALAHLKAACGRSRLNGFHDHGAGPAVVLGADTIVLKNEEILGQPGTEPHAAAMIRSLRGGTHRVLTGVCLIDVASGRRDLFVDRATVHVGEIPDAEVDGYVASGQWRGKAGGYNLAERLADGWPIEFEGDPSTVMGLPMRMLPERLERFATAVAPAGA